MVNLPWLEKVRMRLAKNGLPPSYVQRFMEELTDHLEDLKEENMSTEASVQSRLGEPEQVAEAAVVAYRQRSFLGRHPAAAFAVFGLSPVVSVSVLGIVSLFMIAFACDRPVFLDYLRHLGPVGTFALKYALSTSTIVFPSLLLSVFYCKLARQVRVSRTWMFLSCAVLALTASMAIWTVKVSDLPGQSALMFGLAIPQHLRDLPRCISGIFYPSCRLLQFLVPLTIGLWFLRSGRREQQAILAAGAACKAA